MGSDGRIRVLPRSADYRNGCEHIGKLPLLQHYFQNRAVSSGFHWHGGLVRINLKQHLTLFYRITCLLMPPDKLSLIHVKPQLGHDYNFCHSNFLLVISTRRLSSGACVQYSFYIH